MSNKILYSPKEGTTGFWGLRDVPTQPNEDDYKRHRAPGLNDFIRAESDYIKALESCKSNKVEIPDWDSIDIDPEFADSLKPGDIFDLPEGYEFKEDYLIEDSTGWQHTHELMWSRFPDAKRKKFIRLVKTETKATREDGYYWIRPAGGFWIIGQWYQKNEAFTFLDGKKLMSWPDHSLEVNENRIYRVSQPEPEESQADLWEDFRQKFIKEGLKASKYFTIQRKKQ